jgi:hypothetical protein
MGRAAVRVNPMGWTAWRGRKDIDLLILALDTWRMGNGAAGHARPADRRRPRLLIIAACPGAASAMSVAGLIIVAVLAWRLARSPGAVLALVAVLAAVIFGG